MPLAPPSSVGLGSLQSSAGEAAALPPAAAVGPPLLQELEAVGARWSDGPLLIFPDTSALMSMLGANTDLPKPALALESLTRLARLGRFGRRGVAPQGQVFLVVADSVMKQLDGLKSLPSARAAIRSFLSDRLEECGPAGLDFLTVLGAHEGEGLALSAGALGAAGSRSPFVLSKGQAVDYRIVEVALFFMNEVTHASAATQAPGAPPLPVLLLSNDNAQIAAAKSHGLPAFRLAGEGPQAAALLHALAGAPPPPPVDDGGQAPPPPPALTSRLLRGLLGPAATAGLGSAAPAVPLQQCFDEAVAVLHATASALRDAQAALSVVVDASRAARQGRSSAQEALDLICNTLKVPLASAPGPGEGGTSGGATGGTASEMALTVADSLAGFVAALQGPLGTWDARVRSHEQPSRVLKWCSS